MAKNAMNRRNIEKTVRLKKIKIIEAKVCPDHIHMPVEIPPKVAISSSMRYLKGKSSLIYIKYPEKNISIDIADFGAWDIMRTRQERILKRYRNIYKKTPQIYNL